MDVTHVAKLANLTLSPGEEKNLSDQFNQTLKTIELINELDTSQTLPTSQVTGLENVTREDDIDQSRVLAQDRVLSQALATHQGYFVVPSILDAQ